MTDQAAPAPDPARTAYADADDLAARWRPLSQAERERADILLADASTILRAECSTIDERLGTDPPTLDPDLVVFVACAMVKRAMLAGDAVEGVTQQSQTAGPYAAQVTFTNPTGSLYLTKAERKLIGCGTQRAFTVSMAPAAGDVHALHCSLRFGGAYCSCGSDLNNGQGPIFSGGWP